MSAQSPAQGLKNPEQPNAYLHLKPGDWTEERWRKAIAVVIHAAIVEIFDNGSDLGDVVASSNTAGLTVDVMQDAILAAERMEEASWVDRELGGRWANG